MIFASLIFTGKSAYSSKYDSYGVEFETNEHKILIRTPNGLKNYIVPKECTTIRSGNAQFQSSFQHCSKTLETLEFEAESQIVDINAYAFSNMNALKSVDFTNCKQLTVLNEWLFTYSKAIETMILPPNLVTIEATALHSINVSELTLPDSLKTIKSQSIAGARSLKHVHISENSQLESLGESAFGFGVLNEFYFPKNFKSFTGSCFSGTTLTLTIHKENKFFKIVDDFILSYNGTVLYYVNGIGDITLPSSVLYIHDSAAWSRPINKITFQSDIVQAGIYWCAYSKIRSISLPAAITEVSSKSFYSCQSLSSVTLTENVKAIGSEAFRYCKSLSSINLMKVEEIRLYAFSDCNILADVKLPSSLVKLEQGVFSNCPVINIDATDNEKFYINNYMLFTESKTVLSEFFGEQKHVVIPEHCEKIGASVFAKKNIDSFEFKNTNPLTINSYAFQKSTFSSLTIDTEIYLIGFEAFRECPNLETVVFKNITTRTISQSVFYKCPRLRSVEFPSDIEVIQNEAFYNCSALSTTNLDKTAITTIGEFAFAGTALNTLTLPASFETLSQRAFYNSKIRTLNLKSCNLTSIPQFCFEYCSLLESVEFADSISEIGNEAFCGCKALTSITLPPSIQFIREMAFYDCQLLSKVILPLDCSLETVFGRAFSNCPLLMNITIAEEDTKFVFDEGVLMNKEKTKIFVFLPSSKIKTFVVPANVKTIGPYAFQYCTNLKAVIIPDGNIKDLGVSSFEGCTRLSYVYIPKSIVTVSKNVFNDCTSLRCGSIECAQQIQDKLIDSGFIKREMFSSVCVLPKTAKTTCRFPIRPSIFVMLTLFVI